MRTIRWLLSTLLLGALSLGSPAAAQTSAGGDASGKANADEASSTSAGAKGAKPDKKLQAGLEKLHAGNQAEIQSGKLAEQSASSPDVKAFGQRMVTDHGQNDQQLTSIAQTMGVSLQGKTYQKTAKNAQKMAGKLKGKTGAAFDKAYIDAMVKDHEKDSKEVKKLASRARKDGQTELAGFLDQTESTMQSHLSEAKRVQSAEKHAPKSAASTSGKGSSSGAQ
jgi:putative membrane protein